MPTARQIQETEGARIVSEIRLIGIPKVTSLEGGGGRAARRAHSAAASAGNRSKQHPLPPKK